MKTTQGLKPSRPAMQAPSASTQKAARSPSNDPSARTILDCRAME